MNKTRTFTDIEKQVIKQNIEYLECELVNNKNARTDCYLLKYKTDKARCVRYSITDFRMFRFDTAKGTYERVCADSDIEIVRTLDTTFWVGNSLWYEECNRASVPTWVVLSRLKELIK